MAAVRTPERAARVRCCLATAPHRCVDDIFVDGVVDIFCVTEFEHNESITRAGSDGGGAIFSGKLAGRSPRP